jgi:hypothetical protein
LACTKQKSRSRSGLPGWRGAPQRGDPGRGFKHCASACNDPFNMVLEARLQDRAFPANFD